MPWRRIPESNRRSLIGNQKCYRYTNAPYVPTENRTAVRSYDRHRFEQNSAHNLNRRNEAACSRVLEGPSSSPLDARQLVSCTEPCAVKCCWFVLGLRAVNFGLIWMLVRFIVLLSRLPVVPFGDPAGGSSQGSRAPAPFVESNLYFC